MLEQDVKKFQVRHSCEWEKRFSCVFVVCYEYCFNDKVCKVIEGEAKCDCGADFSGSRCQTAITTTTTPPPPTTTNIICSYLPEDYCKNQGSCIVNNGKAACQCPPTHYGTYCETPVGGTRNIYLNLCFQFLCFEILAGPGTTLRPVTPGPGTIGPGITNSPGENRKREKIPSEMKWIS